MKKPAPFKLEWEAHQYEYKERSSDWFWAVGILTVALAVTLAIFGNIILGLLVLIATFSLALFINREPEVVDVVITEQGITRGAVHYPFVSLHSFWVEMEHAHPRIYVRSQKAFLPLIMVPLGKADGERVSEILSHHLEEEHHIPPFVERLLERLGF